MMRSLKSSYKTDLWIDPVRGIVFALLVYMATAQYRRRQPEKTVLYRVLQKHLATFIAQAEEQGRTIPYFVRRELESFLDCGILAKGFVRVHCDNCGKDHLVALSCKGRGFCSSCGGRRMTETAAYLVDYVFPKVPVRQWVLSLPVRLRYHLAYNQELLNETIKIFIREIYRQYRFFAKYELGLDSVRNVKCGSVTFIQRFGSGLRLNIHLHVLVIDGVYLQEDEFEPPDFYALPDPTDEDVAKAALKTRKRVLELFASRGLGLEDASYDELADEEPLLAQCTAAAMMGTPKKLKDESLVLATTEYLGSRCMNVEGFSVHANVRVGARDRKRLERLCRYVGRPTIASQRLEELPDGKICLWLKKPWNDGTTALFFEPMELIKRLVPLVFRPRTNRVRYHGILAPAANYRQDIVPSGVNPTSKHNKQKNYCWASLMRRAFEYDVLKCPSCGEKMRLIATIRDRDVIQAILTSCGFPADAPEQYPAEVKKTEEYWDAA